MIRKAARLVFLICGYALIGGCDSGPTSSIAQLPIRTEPIQTVDFSRSIEPMPAVPSQKQLDWQKGEMYMFIHFGMNTFTGNEWGDGTDDPQLFNPAELDANQWVSVADETGFKGVILTAKHHDGFSLWPSAFTDYSVAASQWKNGTGDVVREVADAAHSVDMKFGIYLSPWDRHEASYATPAYNDYFVGQLTELLTDYGELYEYWFDGAREAGLPDPGYDTERWLRTVYEYQPNVVVFAGYDIGWVGNEDGIAGETQWSVVDETRWHPVECDTRNRPGWFWRESEDHLVYSGKQLLEIYFSSVGRNCVLLLNVPVNDRGLISAPDIKELQVFRQHLDEIFEDNLLRYGAATASTTRGDSTTWAPQNAIDGKDETFWVAEIDQTSGWIEVSLDTAITFDTVLIQEPIQFGQRVRDYRVETWNDITGWASVVTGTTIGYKKMDRLSSPETTSKIRLHVESAVGTPAIQAFQLYLGNW